MIYLDNAASTPPAPQILAAMARAAEEHFGNPSSAHRLGAAAARALGEARAAVAALVRAQPGEIVFTSGGTEADALGVAGAAEAGRGRHLVVSALEHPAVLRAAERLGERGWEITRVRPGADGVVQPDTILAATRPDTSVVAVMLVNNELGTLQPVADVARALRAAGHRAHLHVDAVPTAGLVPVDVRRLGADSLALSAHKLHGPRGVGALWIRPGARVVPLWAGGGQEGGMRSGTENLPGAIGFAEAATLALNDTDAATRVSALRARLEAALVTALPAARPTLPPGTPVAPHILSMTLPDLPAEPILHALEARGVFISAGSACASRTRGPSHVLAAIGARDQDAILRFSLSRTTRAEDLGPAAQALAAAVADVAPMAALGRGRGR